MAIRKSSKSKQLSLSDTMLALVISAVVIFIFWKWALPWAFNDFLDRLKHFDVHVGK